MGQCLSLAKPIVQEVPTDLANEANKPAEEGAGPQPQAQGEPAPKPPVQGGCGAVHPSLPSDAEQHLVRNVYDGDTLTLVDERRVRLLGIDTPEIKEQQPYAQEAKSYTRDRCHKKEVWISFEPGGEREDRYGRLLCFVWVPADDGGEGYHCVNEGIVEAGYARAYHPGKGERLHNWDRLLELQSCARREGRGVWSDFEDIEVVRTTNGKAYHKRSCEHLSNVRNLTELMTSEAAEQGLHPCRTCFGLAAREITTFKGPYLKASRTSLIWKHQGVPGPSLHSVFLR